MVKKKGLGKRRQIDCTDIIHGPTFWDLALGPGGDESRLEELEEIWQVCGAEIIAIDPDTELWAFERWGFPK